MDRPENTKRKPVILMSGSFDVEPKRGMGRVYYYKNYAEAMETAGALVLNISQCDREAVCQFTALADGLYLTGGGDVDPQYYGETARMDCGEPDPRRDELEFTLARAFLEAEKPIFGVCRGLQVLNILLGGTLWQDISAQTGLSHPDDSIHLVKTADGSLLRHLFGEEFPVNSYHHQAVKGLASVLVPEAWDESGQIVEAFSHRSLPIWAVQWHPERMTGPERYTKAGPDMAPLFLFFCEQCRRQTS